MPVNSSEPDDNAIRGDQSARGNDFITQYHGLTGHQEWTTNLVNVKWNLQVLKCGGWWWVPAVSDLYKQGLRLLLSATRHGKPTGQK